MERRELDSKSKDGKTDNPAKKGVAHRILTRPLHANDEGWRIVGSIVVTENNKNINPEEELKSHFGIDGSYEIDDDKINLEKCDDQLSSKAEKSKQQENNKNEYYGKNYRNRPRNN